MLSHAINFGLGVVLRLANEHFKAKEKEQKLNMALISKKTEILEMQHEKVAASTFLQSLMMTMVFVAMGVLVLFPMLAVFLDVPLVVLWERTVQSGFWIFSSTKTVESWEIINGLYLPEEFKAVMIAAIEFTFGVVLGGVGRR